MVAAVVQAMTGKAFIQYRQIISNDSNTLDNRIVQQEEREVEAMVVEVALNSIISSNNTNIFKMMQGEENKM